jgi:2-polyprenyl-3-methyl-5-hydroxy-6-metoxy-1,4-benzoquinol methylase
MDAALKPLSGKTNRPNSSLETIACDLCGATGFSVVYSVNNFPDDLAVPQNVVRCESCGLLYTDPRPDRALITRLYRKYYMSEENARDAGAAQTFIQRHPFLRRMWHFYCGQYLGRVLNRAGGRVLDIGCGHGSLLKELSDKGCDAYGVELNPDSVEICRKKGLNVRVGSIDDMNFENEFFDTVILWHVIEHVPSPKNALDKIRKVLKPGGAVFLSAPNAGSYLAKIFGVHWFAWQIPFHFYHFSPDTFRKIAEKSGYKIVRLKAVTPEYYFPYSCDIWFRNHFHAGKTWQHIRNTLCTFYFRAAISPVFRIFDAVFYGKGECLQVELQKSLP